MTAPYGIIDLFAGPGGLGEGFSRRLGRNGSPTFKIHVSAEMEPAAHATLTLRAFVRQFGSRLPAGYLDFHAGRISAPDWSEVNAAAWKDATKEALPLILGTPEAKDVLDRAIDEARKIWGDRTIVIGGPPCQAYSLVGRARNRGIAGYTAEDDHRHFLFREYLRVLSRLKPAIFVMENVKGILSSKVGSESIFDLLLDDLRSVGGDRDLYQLMPLVRRRDTDSPFDVEHKSDFVVRAEQHGVPQARHRVILLGIRKDVARSLDPAILSSSMQLAERAPLASRSVLEGLAPLRSGLSKESDSSAAWHDVVQRQMQRAVRAIPKTKVYADVRDVAVSLSDEFSRTSASLPRESRQKASIGRDCPRDMRDWLLNPSLRGTANHSTRGHMDSDLARYFYATAFARSRGTSPKAPEFPAALGPDHRNWDSGKFADRFRVQLADLPSTTITSHISKDGHYFIHPDPLQCRSLTVREAARLQTFPDDYLFLGNRTQQYVQVGNAVPPFLAHQIADLVARLLENDVADLTAPLGRRQDAGTDRMAAAAR